MILTGHVERNPRYNKLCTVQSSDWQYQSMGDTNDVSQDRDTASIEVTKLTQFCSSSQRR